MMPWRPTRRLRQLRSISGRDLDLAPNLALIFCISFPVHPTGDQGSQQWRVAFRSEAFHGTINPDWRPLPRQLCPITSSRGNAHTVLITLHAFPWDDAAQAEAQWQRPEVFPPGSEPLAPAEGIKQASMAAEKLHPSKEPPKEDSYDSSKAAANGDNHACDDPQAGDGAPTDTALLEPLCHHGGAAAEVQLPQGAPCTARLLSLESLPSLGPDLTSSRLPRLTNALVLEYSDGEYCVHQPGGVPVPPPAPVPPLQVPTPPPSGVPSQHTTPGTSPRNLPSTTEGAKEGAGAAAVNGSADGSNGAAAAAGPIVQQDEPAEVVLSALSRPVTVAYLRKQVGAFIRMRQAIEKLGARCEELKRAVDATLAAHAPAELELKELQGYRAGAVELRRKQAVVAEHMAKATAESAAAKKAALVSCQALTAALQALQAANKRISGAAVAFTGEEGQGRLAAALKVLVSRRCFIALQAAAVYRLGPTAVQVLRAPSGLLDHQLEAQWAGAADVPEEEGATVAVACESGATDAPGPLGQSVRDMLCRPEMRLTIGGVELNPAVWRHAFDPEGYQWDSAQDKAAAVALGHAAHLVDRLAAYLGVQLRYPVLFRGSASAILDNYPPAGNWRRGGSEAQKPPAGYFFGRGTAVDVDAAGKGPLPSIDPVVYPLHCPSNRDRPKFAVGVFLLNKDVIQLLQAHGVSSFGPNQLLQNLHKLVACAESALPQGLTSAQWRW